jgi:hypothetical protein
MASFNLPDIGEDFSISGHWWLPDQPDQNQPGRLDYRGGRFILEMMGVLPGIDPFKTFSKVPLIHGAAEAKRVSLVRCYQARSGFKLPGTLETRFFPRSVYFEGYLSEADHSFESWTCALANLGPWIGEEPVNQIVETDGRQVQRISHLYERGEKLSFSIPSVASCIDFGYGIRTENDAYRSKSLNYVAQLTLKPDGVKEADWFTHRITSLARLMSFLIGRATYAGRMFARRKAASGDAERYEVRFNDDLSSRTTKALKDYEILVPMAAIRPDVSDIIDTWFTNEERLEEPTALLAAALFAHQLTINVRLLLLCQFLESFHRNILGGRYLEQEDYELIKEALWSAIPGGIQNSLRDSLRSRIRYGYEYSFLKRLSELRNFLGETNLQKIGIEPDPFIIAVKDARNYFTHWDPAIAVNILKGAELANLVSKLSAVSHIILLKHMGIDPDLVIAKMIENKTLYLQEYTALD